MHAQKKGLPLQCCLGSWSRQPSLTPLLSVAITAVCLFVSQRAWGRSINNTEAPIIKPAKASLQLVYHSPERPVLGQIMSGPGLLLDLHLLFNYTLERYNKSCIIQTSVRNMKVLHIAYIYFSFLHPNDHKGVSTVSSECSFRKLHIGKSSRGYSSF